MADIVRVFHLVVQQTSGDHRVLEEDETLLDYSFLASAEVESAFEHGRGHRRFNNEVPILRISRSYAKQQPEGD